MNGDLGKLKLKEYISKAEPILLTMLDGEIEKAREFGEVQVKMMELFKRMVVSGKGLRGFLVTLGYQLGGAELDENILDTSVFIELFQTSILIHDDFMDRDNLRRGFVTAHKEIESIGQELNVKIPFDHYGNSMAVCLGDAGFYLSWSKLLQSKLPLENVMETGKLYASFMTRLALGQSMDLTVTGINSVNEEDIMKVILLKSAEYSSVFPLQAGLMLAGNKNKALSDLVDTYAKNLGWAFQIQDDILGIFGEEKTFGKPVGSDLSEGKNTLLTVHLRKNGTPEQVEFLNHILGNANVTQEDVEKIKKIYVEAGSYDYVKNLGTHHVEEGVRVIPEITKNKELQDTLESLIVYMIERVK